MKITKRFKSRWCCWISNPQIIRYILTATSDGDQQTKLRSWNRDQIAPANPVLCKVLIHQYAGDIASGLFDFNQINPFLDNPELVIQRLILPPA